MVLLEVNSAFASTNSVFKGAFRKCTGMVPLHFFSFFFLHYTLLQSIVYVRVINNNIWKSWEF